MLIFIRWFLSAWVLTRFQVKERFLTHIQFEKRYSPHTVTAYRTDLDQFFIFIQHQYDTEDITGINHFMIRSWLVSLMDQHLSSRSVGRKLTSLKSFYRYCLKEGAVESNPVSRVVAPKTSKRLPVFIEKENMDLLLDQIDFGEGYRGMRDRLMVELFYLTGMRRSELMNLKEQDIDFTQNTFRVLGKRNKERLIPFTPELGKTLNQYLEVKRSEFGECDQLFLTDKGSKMYPRLIYSTVKKYLSMVTTSAKKSPHVLRHTFATHLLNEGADLNAVKELLGHANLAATQIYTHNTIEKLKRIYKQAHPKA